MQRLIPVWGEGKDDEDDYDDDDGNSIKKQQTYYHNKISSTLRELLIVTMYGKGMGMRFMPRSGQLLVGFRDSCGQLLSIL